MPPIPTNLITGFLGVGKTTAVIDLLKHKSASERWAVLVNEYGDVSIDGAMIEGSSPDGVTVREVGGGCVCCATAPYLPVALHFLLLDAKPDRLIIETTGLGHPARLLDTLRLNYRDRLEVRAVLGIVDPADFARPEMRDNPVFIDQIQLSDVVVMNKLDTATPELVADFQKWVNGLFPPKLLIAGTTHGRLDPAWLDLSANDERLPMFPEAHEHEHPLLGFGSTHSVPGPHPPTPSSQALTPQPPLPGREGERGSGGEGMTAGGKAAEDEWRRFSELAGRDRRVPELLLTHAREMRRDQTTAETFLWECLRNRQLMNLKFRRQHNLGPFIADFYCHEAKFCIELDGDIHDAPEQREMDRIRDLWMHENGFTVLRLRNEQVLGDPVGTLQIIVDVVGSLTPSVVGPRPPTPSSQALTPSPPLPGGEGEKDLLPLSPGERGLGGEGFSELGGEGSSGSGREGQPKKGSPLRYPSPCGVHPACCGWLFTSEDVFDEGKLLGLLGGTTQITRLKGVFRFVDEWAAINRTGTTVRVSPTSYRRDSRLEAFAEGLDWQDFEERLLDCLIDG